MSYVKLYLCDYCQRIHDGYDGECLLAYLSSPQAKDGSFQIGNAEGKLDIPAVASLVTSDTQDLIVRTASQG